MSADERTDGDAARDFDEEYFAEEREEGAAEDEEGSRRHRPGCGCLLRFPFYLLLLVVLLLAGVYLWLESDDARERGALLLEARLSEFFGRDVEVGRVSWSMFPLTIEAWDVVVPGDVERDGPDARPFARIPHLLVQMRLEEWTDWRDPVLEVEQVMATGPEVDVRVREDGTNNLPRFGRDTGGPSRMEVHLGALVAQEGVLWFNAMELPLDFEARSIFARLTGVESEAIAGEGPDAGLALEGLVTAQDARVTLPGGEPYPFTFSARARFGARRIDFERILINGPHLRARTSGVLMVPETERRLELDLAADARVRLAEHLGYLERDETGELPAEGPLRFDGELLWAPDGWSVQGRLLSERLDLADRVLRNVAGELRVLPESLRYEIATASYAGGSLSGLVTVELQEEPRPVGVDLSLAGLDLRTLVADQGLDLEGVHGSLRGDVSYRFTTEAPEEGSGWADLFVDSVRQGPLTEGLALTGHVPLEIDRGVVRTAALRLVSESGSQVLHADGSFDISERAGRFRWDLATSNAGQLATLVPVEEEDGGAPAWLPTAGRGEAEGVLRIRPAGVTVGATFDLYDVESPGLVADQVAGSLSVSTRGVSDLRLQAASDGGALMVTGSVPFEEAGPDAALDLTIDAASWPADERLAAWLPFELPVDGPISGRLELSGAGEDLSGRTDLAVEPAVIAGFEVDLLLVELAFDPGRVTVERGVIRSDAGDLTVAGVLDRGSGAIDFRVEAPSLDLTEDPFAGRLSGDVAGTLSLVADVEGTLEAPEARLRLESSGLTVQGRSLATGERAAALEIVWDGEQVVAEGGLAGLVTLEGGGRLDTERADLSFELATSRLGDLARLVAPEVPQELDGRLAGSLVVEGELGDPENLRVALRLPELIVQYEDHAMRNVEPVVVRYTGEAIAIDSLFLEEPETASELFAQGTIGLGEGVPLDLNLQGSVSTDWAEILVPQLEMEGTFDVLASVGGTLSEPRIDGQGELRDGSLIVDGFPQSLDDLTAVVLFYPNQIVLDRARARVGGGTMLASGRVVPPWATGQGAGLEYSLQTSLDGVTLRYPEGFWLRADAALSLLSTPDGRLLRGTVQLDRAYYVQDIEVSLFQIMRRALRADRLEVAETGEVESTTQLALSISAPGTVRVRNNLADLTGTAELTVRGTLARPIVFGEIEIDRGGTLVYSETEFEVERARLTFASPTRIDPIVDLVATTDVREYDITLNLSGRLDTLQAQVSSDPPLSDLDVVALLTTGQAPAAGGLTPGITDLETFASDTAERFLYGQAASVVSERLETLFGFDTLRISPVTSETGGAIGSVTIGKRLSSEVLVTYTSQPTATEEFLVQVEWQVDENLTLIFTSVEGDSYRVDARWDRRF